MLRFYLFHTISEYKSIRFIIWTKCNILPVKLTISLLPISTRLFQKATVTFSHISKEDNKFYVFVFTGFILVKYFLDFAAVTGSISIFCP